MDPGVFNSRNTVALSLGVCRTARAARVGVLALATALGAFLVDIYLY